MRRDRLRFYAILATVVPFVCFDVIARYLRSLGYDLTYVRNITDVDDKIIKRALENKETCDQLVDRMVQEMYKDFDALKRTTSRFLSLVRHIIFLKLLRLWKN